ncbi:hypothetical protein AALB39_07505 [Lachnospiraceae bacterium 54-53]
MYKDIWNSTQEIINNVETKKYAADGIFQYNNITFHITALYNFKNNIILEFFSKNNQGNIKLLKIKEMHVNGQIILRPQNAVSYFNTPTRKSRTEIVAHINKFGFTESDSFFLQRTLFVTKMNFENVFSLDFIVGEILITNVTKAN